MVNLGSLSNSISVDSLSHSLAVAFGGETRSEVLDLNIEEIKKDAELFSSDEWIFGRKIDFTDSFGARFPWGEIQLHFKVSAGTVSECRVFSDSMDPALPDTVERAFSGLPFSAATLSAALPAGMPEARDIGELLRGNI